MEASPTNDSQARMALRAMPGWSKVLRHFEFSQCYAAIVVLMAESGMAPLCREDLDLWLDARRRPNVLTLRVESPEDLICLPEALLRITPPQGPVWVDCTDTNHGYERAWGRCAMKLNRLCDVIAAQLSAPMILVVPPFVRQRLFENAPDFWSRLAFVAEMPTVER